MGHTAESASVGLCACTRPWRLPARILYESDIPIGCIPEQGERGTVGRTLISCSRLRETVELYEHRTLSEARLAHVSRETSRHHSPASRLERRTCDLRIRSESIGPPHLSIERDPICLGHRHTLRIRTRSVSFNRARR